MAKSWKFVLFWWLIITLVGCGQSGFSAPVPVNPSSAVSPPSPPAAKPLQLIQGQKNIPESNGWTELAKAAADFDGDGAEETLAVLTAAQRDYRGQIMWDDGQEWLIAVLDNEMIYSLFQGYVQLGNIYPLIAFHGGRQYPSVFLLTVTGTGISLREFVFDSEKQGFAVIPHLNLDDINLLLNGIVEYQ